MIPKLLKAMDDYLRMQEIREPDGPPNEHKRSDREVRKKEELHRVSKKDTVYIGWVLFLIVSLNLFIHILLKQC